MSEDALEIPETGAVFTFGRSRFADNTPSHFFVKKDPVVDLACGDEHTVVVCEKGRVFSFGRNSFGELGLGTHAAVGRPNCVKSLKPLKIIHVAAGRGHTLFLSDKGEIYASGNNDEGQLGLGNNVDCEIPQKIDLDNVKQLSAGFKHSAALTEDRQVYVWGDNKDCQLGLGEEINNANVPTHLKLENNIVQICCGYYHTLLLTEQGKIYSFGEGEHGKLGLGNHSNSAYPRMIEADFTASFISAGGNHSCCISNDGKLYLWGSNFHGQLGFDDATTVSVPTQLEFDQTIIYASLGDNHTSIITDAGELYSFGNNRHGKLGLEKTEELIEGTYEPTKIKKFHNYTVVKVRLSQKKISEMNFQVSCGGCHTMVLARPKMILLKSEVLNGRNKNWEVQDVSSSKTTLPPLNRFSHSSSSPMLTPLSPLSKTVQTNGQDFSLSSSLTQIDNLPNTYIFLDEKETNEETNGNYFQINGTKTDDKEETTEKTETIENKVNDIENNIQDIIESKTEEKETISCLAFEGTKCKLFRLKKSPEKTVEDFKKEDDTNIAPKQNKKSKTCCII